MQTVLRQDGTPIELDDETAAKWLKIGLATAPSETPMPVVSSNRKFEPIQTDEGESAWR